ncbi:MAG: BON domain-containing protein [Steroidobacteraceae bacterium]|jgi:hyperosmotically inducible protein
MNRKLAICCFAISAMLGSAVVLATDDSDTDRSHPKAFVKDSAITVKIKARLAAEHFTSLGRIHVDTDKHGVVWLSGHARTQEAIDKAGSIARETENVKEVHNHIKLRKDD